MCSEWWLILQTIARCDWGGNVAGCRVGAYLGSGISCGLRRAGGYEDEGVSTWRFCWLPFVGYIGDNVEEDKDTQFLFFK